jgi:hypothetical protein
MNRGLLENTGLFRSVWLIVALGLIAGCADVRVQEHAMFEPAVDLQSFFQGELLAHGVVKNRSGRIIRTFRAEIDAHWDEGVGVLDERFVFDDGEKQRRKWVLEPSGVGSFNATAGDVIGTGKLELAGNSIFLEYILRIPYRDGHVDVHVDDRMYQVAPDLLVNESQMTKFGVNVGSILLVIQKTGDG